MCLWTLYYTSQQYGPLFLLYSLGKLYQKKWKKYYTPRADRSKYDVNFLLEKHLQSSKCSVLRRTTVHSVVSHHVSDASKIKRNTWYNIT